MMGEADKSFNFPENFLSLDYSFGYDCKRFYNLSVINGDTLLYATGRFLHFLDVYSGELCYFKTPNDGCIGHIAVSYKFFTQFL